MIEELRITDLGVISEATIEPHPGLTVVTGETGAGQDHDRDRARAAARRPGGPESRAYRCRSRADRGPIPGRRCRSCRSGRRGRRRAGSWPVELRELLVARHVTASGRSRAYLGGAQVPAGLCADITADLVTIHGQSEQVRLSDADRQRQLLDRFAGAPVLEPLARYGTLWAEGRAARAELAKLRAEAQSRAREADLLRFGLAEIERVAPQPGEDVALAAEAVRLQAADDLRLAAQLAVQALAGSDDEAGGALASLHAARKAFEPAVLRDGEAAELGSRLAEASYQLADLTADLVRYLDDLDDQPGRLEQIAERRSQLSRPDPQVRDDLRRGARLVCRVGKPARAARIE